MGIIQGNTLTRHNMAEMEFKPQIRQITRGRWISKDEVRELIGDNTQLEVLNCESGLDNTRIGRAGEIGVAQFMPETWKTFNKMRGLSLDIYNPYHQIEMFKWAWTNNLKKHWTCFKGRNNII